MFLSDTVYLQLVCFKGKQNLNQQIKAKRQTDYLRQKTLPSFVNNTPVETKKRNTYKPKQSKGFNLPYNRIRKPKRNK